MSNPRDFIPKDSPKFCSYVHPDDHPTRPGERCQAFHLKNSKFCYFHCGNQEKLRRQLMEARDEKKARKDRDPVKDFQMPGPDTICRNCKLKEGCDYYVPDSKQKCKLFPKIGEQDAEVLSSLFRIKDFSEKLLEDMKMITARLKVMITVRPDDESLLHTLSIHLKRESAVVKDFSDISKKLEEIKLMKQKYHKPSWETILQSAKDPEEHR